MQSHGCVGDILVGWGRIYNYFKNILLLIVSYIKIYIKNFMDRQSVESDLWLQLVCFNPYTNTLDGTKQCWWYKRLFERTWWYKTNIYCSLSSCNTNTFCASYLLVHLKTSDGKVSKIIPEYRWIQNKSANNLSRNDAGRHLPNFWFND